MTRTYITAFITANRGMRKLLLPIVACLFVCSKNVSAQDGALKEVTTAVPLLRIAPDTRAAALGETGIATSPDAASGMLNPAKLVFTKDENAFMIDYAPWLRDITSGSYLISLAGYHKIDDRQALSASIRFFNAGKVEERDYNNNLVQLVTPQEFALDAAYSRLLSNRISVAAAFRFIRSSIGQTVNNSSAGAGSALLADLSAFYNGTNEEGKGFTAGLIIANIGSAKINYGQGNGNNGFVPARIGAGIAYTLPLEEDHKLMLAADFNKSLVPLIPAGENGMTKYLDYGVMESYGEGFGNGALGLSAGAEYVFRQLLAIRAGYFTESEVYGGRKYISTGFGVFYKKLAFNFAYIVPSGNGTDRNALSNSVRFGLCFFPKRSI